VIGLGVLASAVAVFLLAAFTIKLAGR